MSRTVRIEALIDLSEVDDDDIESEAETRGLFDRDATQDDADSVVEYEEMNRLFELFYIGRNDEAIRMSKEIASRVTGRILP